jgi:hypothetical protein
MLEYDPDEKEEKSPPAPAETAAAEPEAGEGEVTVEVMPDPGAPRMSDEKLAELVVSATPTEDEVQRYTKEQRKKYQALRTAFSEQRRRADTYANDAITASNLTERLYRENEELKTKIARSEAALVDQALARAESQLKQASQTYKNALASNDADLITAANVEVARSTAEIDRLKLLKPAAGSPVAGSAGEPSRGDSTTPSPGAPPASARPVPSERTKAWVAANPWFNRDMEMTNFAMRQDQHLLIDGITEATNPDLYFRTIEERMAKQFPDRFKTQRGAEPRTTRPAAVTGGTRTSGIATSQNGRISVRLTESQIRLANRLGLTAEQYAKQLVEEEKEQGRVQ